MATWYPNSIIPYPFSGVLSGFIIHPYHISFLYDELSGIEQILGFNPLNGYPSITERLSGIENGNNPNYLLAGGDIFSGNFLPSDSGLYNFGSLAVPLDNLFSDEIRTNIISGNATVRIAGAPGHNLFINAATSQGVLVAVGATTVTTSTVNGVIVNTGRYLHSPMISGNSISGINYTVRGGIQPAESGVQEIGSLDFPFRNIYSDEIRTNLISGNNNLIVKTNGILGLQSLGNTINLLNSTGGTALLNVTNTSVKLPGNNILYAGVVSGSIISGVNYIVRENIIPSDSGISTLGSPSVPFSGAHTKTVNTFPTTNDIYNEILAGLNDGVNSRFLFSFAPFQNNHRIYVNGLRMTPSGIGANNPNYGIISGKWADFYTPPASGAVILADYAFLNY